MTNNQKIKVFIVDDSRFSIEIIKNLLDEEKFEIVGEALSQEEALKKIPDSGTDIVTMDMTLQDSDGITCTRELLKISPELNILAISSMKDDEIIKKARISGVFDYIQKPIDEEEFNNSINKLLNYEKIFNKLQENYPKAFEESLQTNVKRALNISPQVETIKNEKISERDSKGVSITIGIIGFSRGRIILDTSLEAAKKVAESYLGRKTDDNKFIIDALSEFANVIAGNAISMLNKNIDTLNLRLSPPTAFYGEDLKISLSETKSDSLVIESKYGNIFLNVGFERRKN